MKKEYECKAGHWQLMKDCVECKWREQQNEHVSLKKICPRCLTEKTDANWYGSACFKGTCRLSSIYPTRAQMARKTDKPLPYPMPPDIDDGYLLEQNGLSGLALQTNDPRTSYAALARWWKL